MRRFIRGRDVELGVKNLILHGLRSFLTMLGMVFGVGSVIAMLSVGEGASQEALQQIRMLGSNNIIINTVKPVEEETSGNVSIRMSVYGLTYEDDVRISQTFPAIERTVPVKIIRKEGRLRERAMEIRAVGTTPDWFDLVRRPLLAGRVLSSTDLAAKANVAVLTEHVTRHLLVLEETIGQSIKIGGEYFEVIGVIESQEDESSAVQTPDLAMDVYIPITAVQERYGDVSIRRTAGSRTRELIELHQIIAQVDSIDHVEPTAAGIERMLRRFHKKIDYRIRVPLSLLRQAEATKRTFNIVLGSIAGISLLVGGIGIMNIMLATVTERTREIGVRRAIGAKRSQIIGQFLIETMVLSTVGGGIGILVGLVIPWLITYFVGMLTVVTPFSLLLSLGISMTIGIVFGLYPAVRAARLDPIEALRHE
jgi:putative ABC transport system permease protein